MSPYIMVAEEALTRFITLAKELMMNHPLANEEDVNAAIGSLHATKATLIYQMTLEELEKEYVRRDSDGSVGQ